MTIQPTTSSTPYAVGPSAAHKPAANNTSPEQAPDSVQLSAKARASLDADHDGDSH
jgi:hypothetical protein